MPQLDQLALVYQSQWFWLVMVLVVIFFFVGRGIVPKVEQTVDDRDARIAADLEEAQRLEREAQENEEAWRNRVSEMRAEAQGVTAAAKAEAQETLERRLAAADAEIATKTNLAVAELEAARQSALAEIENVTVEAAQDIVAKLTGAQVAEAEARSAVTGALSNV